MQSFFIGIGASLANGLPYLFRTWGVTGRTDSGVPLTVQYSFTIGAAACLVAVAWTVVSSRAYPPDDLTAFKNNRDRTRGVSAGLSEIWLAIRDMPRVMMQLAVVQTFTWLGLFCMWLFFGLATARQVFGATDPASSRFAEGIEWGGVCFMVYSIVCFLVAFALPGLASATSRKAVHMMALACGGVGLLSVSLIRTPSLLLITMVGVGIAWASILSMPYAILSGALPAARMGVYMGVFNFFIVIPEIIASLTFQPLVKHVFDNNPVYVVMLGGGCLLVAAALVARVEDVAHTTSGEIMIEADAREPLAIPESAQAVPSSGLIDEGGSGSH
jgi:maltose/moltooligosaccharide transporter